MRSSQNLYTIKFKTSKDDFRNYEVTCNDIQSLIVLLEMLEKDVHSFSIVYKNETKINNLLLLGIEKEYSKFQPL